MLVEPVRLREVPDRALRLVVAPPAHNACSAMVIDKLLRPLPHIADKVHDTERACAPRVGIHRIRSTHRAGLVGCGNSTVSPTRSPMGTDVHPRLARHTAIPTRG